MIAAASVLLALQFIVFGLNGFFHFIQVPEYHPFIKILVESGYLYMVKAIEIAGAIILLLPKRRFLGLVILTPIIVNITAYHALLDHRNAAILVPLLAPFLMLVFFYRDRILGLAKG